MKRPLWIVILLALAGIVFLSFVRPHQMVSPGNLIPAHSALQDDCFACHVPLRGATAESCVSCHVVADIGVRTSKGATIRKLASRPAFHQALTEPDCLACHSDHPPPALVKARAVSFDHTLLKTSARARCQSCHTAPRNELHRGQNLPCGTCHQTTRWKPATFAHDRYFMLDRNHNTACTTCHLGGDYRRYTCYGCHEHQPAQILAKHREEGMTNITNCVRCHRSAQGDRGEGGEGRGGAIDHGTGMKPKGRN